MGLTAVGSSGEESRMLRLGAELELLKNLHVGRWSGLNNCTLKVRGVVNKYYWSIFWLSYSAWFKAIFKRFRTYRMPISFVSNFKTKMTQTSFSITFITLNVSSTYFIQFIVYF